MCVVLLLVYVAPSTYQVFSLMCIMFDKYGVRIVRTHMVWMCYLGTEKHKAIRRYQCRVFGMICTHVSYTPTTVKQI